MVGISIRLALALGLHLRNENPSASEASKETLIHAWWSLHSIECLVSTITGRPPVIAFEDCTVPLPHSLPGEQAHGGDAARDASKRRADHKSSRTSRGDDISEGDQLQMTRSQAHFVHIRILLMAQKALLELYSPRTASKSWKVRVLAKFSA